MTNIDILVLINAGILNITDYDLSSASAYKVMRFRNKVEKLYNAFQEEQSKLTNEAGIENSQEFDNRYKELREKGQLTDEESTELSELKAKYDKWVSLRNALLDKEVDLSDVKTIPYEDWHILRKENKADKDKNFDPLNNHIESLLENILWKQPEE